MNYEPTYLGEIELSEDTLSHYGVKGMEWGKRRKRNKKGSKSNRKRRTPYTSDNSSPIYNELRIKRLLGRTDEEKAKEKEWMKGYKDWHDSMVAKDKWAAAQERNWGDYPMSDSEWYDQRGYFKGNHSQSPERVFSEEQYVNMKKSQEAGAKRRRSNTNSARR